MDLAVGLGAPPPAPARRGKATKAEAMTTTPTNQKNGDHPKNIKDINVVVNIFNVEEKVKHLNV